MEKNTRDELIKVGAYIDPKSIIKVDGDGELSVPNWTIRR